MARKKVIVEKRNILNEMLSRFNLQELRLFSIYLGRINPRDQTKPIVRLEINDFYRIMDLQPQRDKEYLNKIVTSLLTKVIYIPDEKNNSNFRAFVLFKECAIESDAKGNRYFEIEAHEKAIPLLFDYKRDYFKYELWNVLNLESSNQIRMYEILKQYEWRGERIISVAELKALLGIERKEYPSFGDFKKRVLDACKKALKEKTDIEFTYEPHLRSGRGGKIQSIRFVIIKNTDYVCHLKLDNLIYKFIEPDVLKGVKYENTEQSQESTLEPDVTSLKFIQEPLTDRDKLFILQAANGDATLVEAAYDMAKSQGGINNLTAWLISMIGKLKNDEISPPVNVKKQTVNRFNNFDGHNYDFNELERLELELLMAGYNKMNN